MIQDALHNASARLTDWLDSKALPVWWEIGADKAVGGFFEAIAQDGTACRIDRRARVQPRQIYCYAAAGHQGWNGPWEEAVGHGLRFFDETYLLEDGLYGAVASSSGTLTDRSFDLYNQAFALFALAQAAKSFPENAEAYGIRAATLLGRLKDRFAHPFAGFEEQVPRVLPLCSNPHMHLFEAALAWHELGGVQAYAFGKLADEIAELCLGKFIDPATGALREFFDGDWEQFAEDKGRTVEPGHQFEWAWLLVRWGTLRGRDDALLKARRLFDIAETYGICATRKVAIMALNDDFTVRDGVARLWPQTEWIKAAIALASVSSGAEQERYLASTLAACQALELFLNTPVPGLWRDKMKTDGSFIDEPAPASSFYHILCSIYELSDRIERLSENEPAFETLQPLKRKLA
ncbi:AGE family epimerase/isomerase [Stappia sp. BW2]|uniref:AGE family epimerase/isomerase n=1 Tax=Stappia sp. BW2 TaxID=2592622 RepID=UPI0011DE758E|nr:AGE family epimerase/isomerase [Stappia sp. BW2]TYC64044.1 AGE family epimerase/isomerase [Stappia sp. BW2]